MLRHLVDADILYMEDVEETLTTLRREYFVIGAQGVAVMNYIIVSFFFLTFFISLNRQRTWNEVKNTFELKLSANVW